MLIYQQLTAWVCLATCALLTAASVPASAETGAVVVSAEQYIAAADAKALHEHPYWRVLLHVRPGLFGSQSLVDDPDFFLAETGKTDPRAELHATLRGLLLPAPPSEDKEARKQHAGCRFPARQAWLAEQLDIPDAALGMPECEELRRILDRIQPQGVSLVYPAAYMNSPASLFGHTLLSINSEHQSDLMNHAINYSAVTEETNGVVFAIKGIFGQYPGHYNVMPYHRKVRDYNHISQRDIWEFPLNFTPEEVHLLMLHVWELTNVYADYFFFSENCSYNLLFLLEAARPGLELLDEARPWVIPLDTVKIVQQAGLVKDVVYRPSKATEVRNLAAQVSADDRAVARDLATGKMEPDAAIPDAEPSRRARVLDLAVEGLQSVYFRKQMSRETYVPRFRQLLIARSKLDPPEGYMHEPAMPGRPDQAHASARIVNGAGSDDGDAYYELSLRPAYHDLLDPETGYLAGSEIQFLNLTGRWYDGDDTPELQRFDLLTIVSLSPRDEFFSPVSWKLLTGMERQRVEDGDYRHLAYLNTGGGFAWQLGPRGMVYTMVEADTRLGSIDYDYAVGLALSAGFLAYPHERYGVHAFVRATEYLVGDSYTRLEATLRQRVTLRQNLALLLDVAATDIYGESYLDTTLRLAWYF